MVEAFIKVVMTEERDSQNRYYGNTKVSKLVEEHLYIEKYERDVIPTFGVKACITIGEAGQKFNIIVNRHYLMCGFQRADLMICRASFQINGNTYEVEVASNNKSGQIESVRLSEWTICSDLTDLPDNEYDITDFMPYTEE